MIDTDKSGTLTQKELLQGLGADGGEQMFKWLDAPDTEGSDGKITLPEWVKGQFEAFSPDIYSAEERTKEIDLLLDKVQGIMGGAPPPPPPPA